MVLGKTSSTGASYNLDDSRARAYCTCSVGVGGGGLDIFTLLCSSFLSLLFLPLSGRRPDID